MPPKCQVFRHQINFFQKKTAFSPVTIRLSAIAKKCQVFRHPFWGKIFGMNFATPDHLHIAVSPGTRMTLPESIGAFKSRKHFAEAIQK